MPTYKLILYKVVLQSYYNKQKQLGKELVGIFDTLKQQKIAKIIISMSTDFLSNFFDLNLPAPGVRYPAGSDAKSDLKLILEIATKSRLKQGQDKKNQNKQIFYCRSLGKQCFKIEVGFTFNGYYEVLNDYTKMTHKCNCQKAGQEPIVIKIYNLMMLKKSLIYKFMITHGLVECSPETILQKISGESGQYFYCQHVSDLESRRKLKKRFDNIVNISIKKKKQIKNQRCENRLENSEPIFRKKRGRKNLRAIQNIEIYQQKQKQNLKCGNEIQEYEKKYNPQSNSSIFYKNGEQDDIKANIPSLIFPPKDDIFYEDEYQKNFTKFSNVNINIGSNNYWPQSDHSIGLAANMRLDGFFKNNLSKNLDRKSLQEIDFHVNENYDHDLHN